MHLILMCVTVLSYWCYTLNRSDGRHSLRTPTKAGFW